MSRRTKANGWLQLLESPPELGGTASRLTSSPDLRMLVIDGGPELTTAPSVAEAILLSMGKSPWVTGGRDHASDAADWALCWLVGYETRMIVLTQAQTCSASAVRALILLALRCGASVVLVAGGSGSQDLRATVAGYGGYIGGRKLPSAPRRSDKLEPGDRAADTHLRAQDLPANDWPTFLAECRDVLNPDAYAQIHRNYAHGFNAVLEGAARGDISALLEDAIADAINEPVPASHRVARVRGMQAAAFTCGWNVRVHVRSAFRLLARESAVSLTREDLTALTAYRDTARPAVCTLWGRDLSADGITEVTISDIQAAVRTGRLGNAHLHDLERTFLKAHLSRRLIAEPHEPFFEAGPLEVRRILLRAAVDVGLRYTTTKLPKSANTLAVWQHRTGVHIAKIT